MTKETTVYMTVAEAAKKWGCSTERVGQWLREPGRIPGAIKPARDWLIPAGAKRPKAMAPYELKNSAKI